MLSRLMLAAGVWACLVGGSWAQEGEVGPPQPQLPPPPPPAFATRPRDPMLAPPGGPCACGHAVEAGPCWRRMLCWVFYRPLPTQCHCGYFCSSCRGGDDACGCRRPSPCCYPHLYTFFLDRCPGCKPPIGLGPGRPPVFPEPGDPPLNAKPHDVLPAP